MVQIFKNLHIRLLHELVPVNPGNSNGQDTCLTPRELDFKKIAQGGSHDVPAFSW